MVKNIRVREKGVQRGIESLDNSELVALLVSHGVKGHSALDIANKVCKQIEEIDRKSKNFNETLVNNLKFINGLGSTKIVRIVAGIELGRRLFSVQQRAINSRDVSLIFSFLRNRMQEEVHILLLDASFNVISRSLMFKGTFNSSLISAREIFIKALQRKARSIIIVHNHPSGNAQPSIEDIEYTKRLRSIGDILDIQIIDHIIITNNTYYSFKDNLI